MIHARQIVEEPEVTKTLDDARKRFPRIDEAYRGFQWRLAREPETGYPVHDNQEHYIMKFEPLGFTGVYTFDENTVHLLSIRIDI